MGMLVNARSAQKCCRGCSSEFGHSNNSTAKTKFKRSIRRREKQNLRKNNY